LSFILYVLFYRLGYLVFKSIEIIRKNIIGKYVGVSVKIKENVGNYLKFMSS
jgi:hypothetical protein